MVVGRLFVAVGIIYSFVSSLSASPWDWVAPTLSNMVPYINGVLDSVETTIQKVPFKNPQQYAAFKLQADKLQLEISRQLAIVKEKRDEASVKKAQALVQELEKQQDKILAEAKKTLHANDYNRLEDTVKKGQSILDYSVLTARAANILSAWWKEYAIPALKDKANEKNKMRLHKAMATQAKPELSFYEKSFRSRRQEFVQRGLTKFLQQSVNPVNIGIVFSGGGYRAMVLSSGYAKAFEDMGLLDASLYISSLSGSTWFLVPWLYAKKSVADFQQTLWNKIQQKRFNIADPKVITSLDTKAIVANVIWPKFLFDQPINSVDLFGALLADILLADLPGAQHQQTLSDQWLLVQNGDKPFPIYTSVSMHQLADGKYHYNWYEFNPLEVQNLELQMTLPAYAFGSKFFEGKSVEIAPEQSIGNLLGMFGSAYTINMKDIHRVLFSDVHTKRSFKSTLEEVQYKVSEQMVVLLQTDQFLGKSRVWPAQMNNPFKGIPAPQIPAWLSKRDYITLVDAGIDYNVPVLPLMRPERKMNVLFVCDSSSNAHAPEELYKFFTDAQRQGITYKRVDDQKTNKVIYFYKPNKDTAPYIVYVTFMKDAQLLKKAQENPDLKQLIMQHTLLEFDPLICLQSFCGTFNFDYTAAQAQQLAALAECNIKANAQLIRDFLIQEFYQTTLKPEDDIQFGS